VVFADIIHAQLGTLDPQTGEFAFYPTPTPNSGPRRGNMDNEDNFWFGEFGKHRVGKFNSKTGEITEYKLPTPFSGPYEVFFDRKTGMVWGSQFYADQMYRLDPGTGEVVEFRLPTRDTQTRRTWVDHSTNPPGVWYPVMARGKLGRMQLQE